MFNGTKEIAEKEIKGRNCFTIFAFVYILLFHTFLPRIYLRNGIKSQKLKKVPNNKTVCAE
jgi:hypothetical protein